MGKKPHSTLEQMFVGRIRLCTTFSIPAGFSTKVFSEAHPREEARLDPAKYKY